MKLTKEQQKLVEDNHNLIYWYAKYNNLNVEEFYHHLAMGLCRAAKGYNDKKGKFSTFATTCMKNEIRSYFKEQNVQKRIPEDMLWHFENIWDIVDFFPSSEKTEHKAIYDVTFNEKLSEICKLLTDNEKEIVFHLLKNKTMVDIAKIKGVSKQCIQTKVVKIRKKITDSGILKEYLMR